MGKQAGSGASALDAARRRRRLGEAFAGAADHSRSHDAVDHELSGYALRFLGGVLANGDEGTAAGGAGTCGFQDRLAAWQSVQGFRPRPEAMPTHSRQLMAQLLNQYVASLQCLRTGLQLGCQGSHHALQAGAGSFAFSAPPFPWRHVLAVPYAQSIFAGFKFGFAIVRLIAAPIARISLLHHCRPQIPAFIVLGTNINIAIITVFIFDPIS